VEAVLRLRRIRQAFTTRGRQVLALDNVPLDVQRAARGRDTATTQG
jgi:hypothetical protein